ncbi:MAG: hypothetical protein AVDCRST_MAG44-1676, partial [uncultured Sphingomonas sp.]
IRSVEQPDHLGGRAADAGLLGRAAAAVGLRDVQRAARLSRHLLRHAERLVPVQQRQHLPGRPDHSAGDGDRGVDPDV